MITDKEREEFELWWKMDTWDLNVDIKGVAEDAWQAARAYEAAERDACRALLERCLIDVLIDHPYLRSGSDYTKAWLRDLITAITEQLKGGK